MIGKATWSVFGESLHDFRRTWPQLFVTDLVSRALAFVIIAPSVGLVGKIFLWRSSDGVVTDAGIITFLLNPLGLLTLVVMGTISLGVFFAELGQLLVIGFGATEKRRVTWLDAFFYSYRRALSLIVLGRIAVVRLLLLATPFVAAIGGTAWLLIRTHDINYYLSKKPPEFILAAAIAGVLGASLALLVAWKIAGWLYSIPMVLFEDIGGRQSLKASIAATSPNRSVITLWLLGWLGGTWLALIAVTQAAGLLGRVAAGHLATDSMIFLVALSFIIVGGVLCYLAVLFFSTVMFPLFIIRLYRSHGGSGRLQPEIAPRGSLGDTAMLRIPGKIVIASTAAIVAAVALGVTLVVNEPGWQDPTEIIAHRGGAWVAPENTIAAFERANADGADWIELDVQENADGEVVVEHDRDFMRAAGVALEVWQATADDLAVIDIGGSFSPEFADERVPTFRQVLELARGKVGVFIELKYYGHNVDLEQKVIDLVEETGMTSNVVIMSLDLEGLQRAQALRPDWTYGLLNAAAIGDLTQLDLDFLALTTDATKLSMVRRTHEHGMKMYPWTVNDPVQMWMMMSRGADGIITDRVAVANRVKELRAEVTPAGRFIIWIAGEIGLLKGLDDPSLEEDA